jgi:hypothetical protein
MTLFHYKVFFFISSNNFCLKICFVWYQYNHPSSLVVAVCDISFSILLFSVYLNLMSLVDSIYSWILFSYPNNYCFFFFNGTWIWTQGLVLARQTLYHLPHTHPYTVIGFWSDCLNHLYFMLLLIQLNICLPLKNFLKYLFIYLFISDRSLLCGPG